MEDHYSVEEAAKRLGASPETVRRWIRVKHIRAIRPGLRAWRIPASEVTRLLTWSASDERRDDAESERQQKHELVAA